MSAFGLSQTGKNAQSALGQIPPELLQQFRNLLGSSDWQNAHGNDLLSQSNAYNQGILNNPDESGLASPGDIRSEGAQVMPGVDAAIDQNNTGLNALRSTAAGLPSGQSVTDTLNGNVNNLNDANFNLNKNNANRIYETASGLQDMSDQNYNGLGGQINSEYGDLRKNAGNTYDQARGQFDSGYDSSLKSLDRLLPSGDLAAAASARSFAPAMAAAQRRLRTEGIDPNSTEAAGILGQVDANRARASDDQLAQTNKDYITQGNQLRTAKGTGDSSLTLDQGATDRGLQTDQGTLSRANTQNQFQSNAGILTDKNAALTNEDNAFYGRNTDIANSKNQIAHRNPKKCNE